METRRYLYAALACCALEILRLQAEVLPYTPSQGSQCHNLSEEYYEGNIHKCCRLCPPGFRVDQRCNNDVNTQCVECAQGLFKTVWSRADRCFRCSPQCKEGFVEEKPCTNTQNRECWCPPGHFCSSLVSGKCYHCQPYQKCPMGYGVMQAGTRETDVECAPCQPGTFSNHESHQNICTPHRICQPVHVPGNGTHDTVCGRPGEKVRAGTTSPQLRTSPPLTTARKELPSRVGTERPTFHQHDPSAQTGRIVGMTAIPVVLVILICFIVFRKSGQKCVPLWEAKKQPFSPAEKFPVKWPQEPTAVGQEKDSLLQTSPSSFWDGSAENSNRICNGDPAKVETDHVQQRSAMDQSCCSTADSTGLVGNGKTHVNVSCVVSICNGSAHLPALEPRGWPKPDAPWTPHSRRKRPPERENPAGQSQWRLKTVRTSWTPAAESPSRLASRTLA
ncbi:LOW QUALITY PROTEIN: tumor necrosis factor receptor superfamily member 1B [Erythrolamprus reginae]|uniref:LOW QUALITY PROTEIN: tumor necrosis factor receptor superfamily member 1B n=1 Tax=Erythrolamprus reginae TaxID=121349 RepID=UPI00396C5296